MSERSLEDRLFDAVWQRNEKDVHLAISTALTLARREGYVEALDKNFMPEHRFYEDAERALPLPTRTVRKPRKPEPDPHGSLNDAGDVITYTVDDGLIMAQHDARRRSTSLPPATQRRVTLWFDLMQRPYHEEEQAVDPNEVLLP